MTPFKYPEGWRWKIVPPFFESESSISEARFPCEGVIAVVMTWNVIEKIPVNIALRSNLHYILSVYSIVNNRGNVIISLIKKHNIPLIMDAKVNDIGYTNETIIYAQQETVARVAC